jgi:hypothetical protein
MGMGHQASMVGLAACLLAACSADTPSATPAADTSEPEAPADSTSATAWPADYAAMRTAAAGWAADQVEAEQKSAAQYSGPAPDAFDLFSCAAPDNEPGEVDARTKELAQLAHEAVLSEARLKAAGYSPDIWSDALQAEERAALELLSGPVPDWGTPEHNALIDRRTGLRNQSAATMELRRQALQPELPPIISEGGCGAFETPFLVRADPPDGRVWVTTRFTFQTCQALGKSAWDVDQCRWTEVQQDRPAELSGTYMVQARWPDGRTLRSSQRFQPDPNLESEEAVPVTIRPG